MIPEGGLVPQCPTIFVNGVELECGCGLAELLALFQNLVNFSIYLAVMILTLVIVYIGFLLVTQGSNPTVRSRAKRIAQSAIIGFVIAIAAFTIVDLIMRTFAKDSNWAGILGTEAGSCVDPMAVRTGSGGGSQNVTVGGGGSGDRSHAEALAQLQAAGIGVSSSGNCSDRNDRTCTSLEGMRQATIDQVIALREACDCAVTVTGGTEAGHSSGGTYSHARGYKIDIRTTSDLVEFFRDNFSGPTQVSWGVQYRDPCRNAYVVEDSHIDIQVTNGACTNLIREGGN